jgi:hypothetical protein
MPHMLAGGAAVAWPLAARPQQSERITRVRLRISEKEAGEMVSSVTH